MSGFFDPGAVSITYSSTTHRWWRIMLSGGNWVWDTSPDAITWTNQRTSTAPSWATSGTTLSVALASHRDAGTNDFSEFDNFNYIAKTPPPKVINQAALIRASVW
jgi:D-alanyl-D-alanine dipeptidase